ncbi:MAG: hypothetical protein CSA33_00860 [Desulfobulbus propionicus]|nr:MAG: hypothetical protein CSA33_00860 [Desulfobulbus propionicus]
MQRDKKHHSVWSLALVFLLCLSQMSPAAERGTPSCPQGDHTVNSLLATDLDGFDYSKNTGLALQVQQAENLLKGLHAQHGPLNGHNITLSYDGSSGLLGFSAGYIYAREHQGEGILFLDIDPLADQSFHPSRSWYMAFDLSGSYEYDDDISFGFGSKTMLMKAPFDTVEGKLFSLLFNMPISIKNRITITPEVQWSRNLPPDDTGLSPLAEKAKDSQEEDLFYGGVSISFSY